MPGDQALRGAAQELYLYALRYAAEDRIDAIVAHGYGLTDADYRRILDSFSHKSQPDLPTLCRDAFARTAPHGRGIAA